MVCGGAGERLGQWQREPRYSAPQAYPETRGPATFSVLHGHSHHVLLPHRGPGDRQLNPLSEVSEFGGDMGPGSAPLSGLS